MKLDIGCGKNKKMGFIGLDKVKLPGVDIVCDLDKEKIPLQDNSIEEVFSMHFMEHTADLLFVMEEVWRICKNEAKITIAVPYFTSVGAFRDPTHKRFFAYETFDHFTNTKKLPSFYSKVKFKIIKKKILFYPANSNIYGKIRFIHMIPFQLLANMFPYFYEHSFFKLFSGRDLYIELKVIK
jgi:ubiquinone/menaquinone biosynthesis C-methylase UbiE